MRFYHKAVKRTFKVVPGEQVRKVPTGNNLQCTLKYQQLTPYKVPLDRALPYFWLELRKVPVDKAQCICSKGHKLYVQMRPTLSIPVNMALSRTIHWCTGNCLRKCVAEADRWRLQVMKP